MASAARGAVAEGSLRWEVREMKRLLAGKLRREGGDMIV